MPYEIVNEFPHPLFQESSQPCISLYQPTHRHLPDSEQDLIRYKNLLTSIEQSLREKYATDEVKRLMKPLFQLEKDRHFWEHTTEGLALFTNGDKCIIYQLRRPVKELANVAPSFHIKPLIRVFQSADRYHLLGLNRKRFTLFEGNRYGLEEVILDSSIARTIEEALGDQYRKKQVTAGTYSGKSGTAMFHGRGSKKEVIDIDVERYFRHVDRTVLQNYSKPMELPLYLVALDEYHTPFHTISHNPYLQKKGIRLDYEALTLEQLTERAWDMIEPIYLRKTKALVEKFHEEQSKFKASSDIAQVARAATENRIEQLLIESDRVYPGKVKQDTGELIDGKFTDPEIDDVLDDIAEFVFNGKGEVVVVPKERMPTETGVAAIYRY